MGDTLQRKTHNAFASLCVSIKAIPTASRGARREVFFSFRLPSGDGRTRSPSAPRTRDENKPDSPTMKRNKGMEELCDGLQVWQMWK